MCRCHRNPESSGRQVRISERRARTPSLEGWLVPKLWGQMWRGRWGREEVCPPQTGPEGSLGKMPSNVITLQDSGAGRQDPWGGDGNGQGEATAGRPA